MAIKQYFYSVEYSEPIKNYMAYARGSYGVFTVVNSCVHRLTSSTDACVV